jgi:hypothetical protein
LKPGGWLEAHGFSVSDLTDTVKLGQITQILDDEMGGNGVDTLIDIQRLNFADCNYDFKESLSWSFRNPIDPKTVIKWIRKHIKNRDKRIEILSFLVNLSIVDGKITNKEKQMLVEILPLLTLSESDLENELISLPNFT